ncbi:hypothetical protein BDV95DRAFT_94479 [Massariosphaeria phaeospora]|uniref:Uncharacterized protein n=1 Tax=Massariosphaeria phaeospora TaxID=100035 RepID=A0A7C8I7A0_9PLEO|nr:hypothetical protein BDV95DRAFT_94479 [Massariosphaeria phaeospora]
MNCPGSPPTVYHYLWFRRHAHPHDSKNPTASPRPPPLKVHAPPLFIRPQPSVHPSSALSLCSSLLHNLACRPIARERGLSPQSASSVRATREMQDTPRAPPARDAVEIHIYAIHR